MRFAMDTESALGEMGSFCVWSKDHKLNEVDLDPNYLQLMNIGKSPFHQVLHRFQMENTDKPLLHVDIHGKMDRSKDYELDLGVACLLKHWDQY